MRQKISLIVIEVKKDCMKKFCKDLEEHPTKIINYEKIEMIPLAYKENKSYKKQKSVIYAKKDLVLMMMTKKIP